NDGGSGHVLGPRSENEKRILPSRGDPFFVLRTAYRALRTVQNRQRNSALTISSPRLSLVIATALPTPKSILSQMTKRTLGPTLKMLPTSLALRAIGLPVASKVV